MSWEDFFWMIFIGCGVWSVMIGAMLVWCWNDEKSVFITDLTDEEAEAIENEMWQYEQDQLELQEHGH